MRAISHHLDVAVFFQCARRFAQGAGGVDEIVDQHAGAALNIADDVHHLGDVGLGATFIDDGEVGIAETFGQGPRPHHAADIGRHHDLIGITLAPDVAEQNGRGVDVVHRHVEKTLDLVGVQIDGEHTVGTDAGDHVGHHLGRDRHPRRTRPPVLARITEIRDYRSHARGRRAAHRVHHHQQFHDVVVGGNAGGLDDEDVLAADVLHDLHHHLAVAETADDGLAQWDIQVIDDVFRELAVGIAGKHQHRVIWHVGPSFYHGK